RSIRKTGLRWRCCSRCWRRLMGREFCPAEPRFSRAVVVTAIGLTVLTVSAFWRAIHLYFFSDDFVLLKHARSLRGALKPLFTTGGGDGFFRPIGYMSLAFTSAWAGASPVLWHATALALHITNSVLLHILALKLGRSKFA